MFLAFLIGFIVGGIMMVVFWRPILPPEPKRFEPPIKGRFGRVRVSNLTTYQRRHGGSWRRR